MNKKVNVRIIKRSEREYLEAAAQNAEPKKSTQETARDMVTTVSGWVNEFQQRRRRETKQALKTLFPEPAPRHS